VIKTGPLAKLEGQIVKVNARARRATVEVPILGDVHRVDVGIIVTKADTQDDQEAETE
jgi:predicted lipoprotein